LCGRPRGARVTQSMMCALLAVCKGRVGKVLQNESTPV
jgi:hypothetical protein